MITAIKDSNVEVYKNLFEEASDILSGYERVQTFDVDKKYYYKDSSTGEFIEYIFTSVENDDKLYEFANALVEYTIMYTPILNPDGTEKGAVENFSSKLGITTLEEYFNWLPDLKRDVNGNPTKYTILPLDEPHFEINANTRAINIPNEFKKNGIAVQGDDLAEIVYFKVDRYFDAMDLNNTEIYIEWETPKDKTHEAVKALSDVYIRDIESEPGKLIFGWAISDAITAAAGTLKFSVKFLQWVDDAATGKKSVAYALNTLTAQVAIQQSIGLNLETDSYIVDNANDRLLERIEPGVVVGGLQAETPYFLENLDGDYEYDIVPDHTNGTLKLYAVATAADTGSVTYVWKRKDLDANNHEGLSEIEIPNSMTTEMVPVSVDTSGYPVFVDRHAYYYGDNYIPFEGTIEDVKTKWPDSAQAPAFYEKKAVLEVEQYGVYTVEARNRIFNSMSKKKSNSATFKRPEAIVMNNNDQVADKHIIGEDSAVLAPVIVPAVGDMSYQWYKAPEGKILSDIVELTAYPVGTQITYGEDYVRICAPEDQSVYSLQNVGEGGNSNTYYGDIRFYYPEGAIKFKEANWNTNNSAPDMNDAEFCMIVDEHPGVDAVTGRKYILDWLPLAYYIPSTKIWTPYGWNKPFGEFAKLFYRLQWFDENDNLLRDDYIEYQYCGDKTFKSLGKYEVVEGATDVSYTATKPGIYKLEATRKRNRAETKNESIEYRVTNAPLMPEFVEGTFNGARIEMADLLSGVKSLSITLKDNIDSDRYYVTWVLRRGSDEDPSDDLPITTQSITSNSSSFNPTDAVYDSIFAEAGVDKEGFYYATVVNKLNGVMSDPTAAPSVDDMFIVTGDEQ